MTREVFVAAAAQEGVAAGAWVGPARLVLVTARCADRVTGKVREGVRYDISSPPAQVQQQAGAVRQPWGIGNGWHGVLGVAFDGGRVRQRDRNGSEGLAPLKRRAVSLLRQGKAIKAGVKGKRKAAGGDGNYLLHRLFESD